MKTNVKRVLVVLGLLAVVALVILSLLPKPVVADIVAVNRGPITVVVVGAGKVRVRQRHIVAVPVPGVLSTVSLRPGDEVDAGTVVATVRPSAAVPLDARSRAEMQARLNAAKMQEAEAQANVQRLHTILEQLRRDVQRTKALHAQGTIPSAESERVETEEKSTAWQLEVAEAGAKSLAYTVESLKASLAPVQGASGRGDAVPVTAPVRGRVLRVMRESAGPIEPGAPLLEMGDLHATEVVVDLLTTEAIRVKPGARVEVIQWGGPSRLTARVRLVEPQAFTKVSALGVEEQRVNTILDPVGDPALWMQLGDGYRVEVRIVVDEKSDVVRVPLGALFRRGDTWQVIVNASGKATIRNVTTGVRGDTDAEVLAGLSEGERVVLYPSDRIEEGIPLRAASEGAH